MSCFAWAGPASLTAGRTCSTGQWSTLHRNEGGGQRSWLNYVLNTEYRSLEKGHCSTFEVIDCGNKATLKHGTT